MMPPIWDPGFRRGFYERWGRESALISAHSRRAEYPEYSQLLSIKMARGGTEDYHVDGQRIAVDDDTYLILNSGRRYGSSINSTHPVHSVSIFFETGMAEDVRDSLQSSTRKLLDLPADSDAVVMQFAEHLREHDGLVTPVLRHICNVVDADQASQEWLDEQLRFLLVRMLRAGGHLQGNGEELPGRGVLYRELQRRLGFALTFIHTHYRERLGLADIARAAHLSAFHCLRAFKATYGVTPSVYLNRKRLKEAGRLLARTQQPLAEIADQVGFGCRTTLFRHLRAASRLAESGREKGS
jgi:AraC-like DNA-binding protein